MKVVGLITEYNPFHNGHKYHIDEAKRLTGADYAIVVMSGDFVQRGTPAVIDKYSRTEMALRNGVDLVFELPVCYASGSAEFFAHGAISLLDKLGIVDYLCFGSECGDINLLQEAASFLLNTPDAFDVRLQAFLKDGLTYPAARQKALEHSLEEINSANSRALAQVLVEPNNILGIEYMKALIHLNSPMIPVTIQRISSGYHDINLSSKPSMMTDNIDSSVSDREEDNKIISSATAIRRTISSMDHNSMSQYSMDNDNTDLNSIDNLQQIESSIPHHVYSILKENYLKSFPISEEDFASIIKYKLLSEDKQSLMKYLDITSDLADRMKNDSSYNCSFSELAGKIKTKNMTLTRINRALIHILLNINIESFNEYNAKGYTQYARVLGLKKESSKLIRKIETSGRIPVITKVSKAEEQLDALGMRMLSGDLFATHIYNQAVFHKYKTVLPNEYRRGICIE